MSEVSYREVFNECTCCDKEIYHGNAFAQIERAVQQIDSNPDGLGLISTMIDNDVLAVFCAGCGNKNFLPSRIFKQVAELLDISVPKTFVVSSYNPDNVTPDSCNRCGAAIHAGNAMVTVDMMVAQADWVEELEDSVVTPIYVEGLFTFCASCGNRMTKERLYEAVRQVLIYPERGESLMEQDAQHDRKDGLSHIAQTAPATSGTLSKPVKIIDIGAEGGGITLHGWKDGDEWWFQREVNEMALDDEDVAELPLWHRTGSVRGWGKALEILAQYPWPCLYPKYVHPEFAGRVMEEVHRAAKEGEDRHHIDLEYWADVCSGKAKKW